MSYKRISVRFNMDVDAERKAWEIIHEKGNGIVSKEIIKIDAEKHDFVLLSEEELEELIDEKEKKEHEKP